MQDNNVMSTFLSNVNMSYNNMLKEDTRRCEDLDGCWWRINKHLAMMNYTSEKSKHEAWRWGTGCDGEEQVDVESKKSS
jgi:hypothetical protein